MGGCHQNLTLDNKGSRGPKKDYVTFEKSLREGGLEGNYHFAAYYITNTDSIIWRMEEKMLLVILVSPLYSSTILSSLLLSSFSVLEASKIFQLVPLIPSF